MLKFVEKIDLSDYSLIVPSVSVGNVGQLTNDLLISVYNLTKVATIYHKAIIPAVGSNPYDPDSNICISCELYACKHNKIAILQLRTSIEQKFADDFFNEFKTLIFDLQFKNVIILTSSHAHERHNINSSQFRYISNRANDVLERLQILPLEVTQTGTYVIYGGGYAVKLYNKLNECISTTVLIKYTSEGDNRPDAFATLQIVTEMLGIPLPTDIKQPYSWNLVYGGPPPIGIF